MAVPTYTKEQREKLLKKARAAGFKSLSEVSRFQEAWGIKNDGDAGPETTNKLKEVRKKHGNKNISELITLGIQKSEKEKSKGKEAVDVIKSLSSEKKAKHLNADVKQQERSQTVAVSDNTKNTRVVENAERKATLAKEKQKQENTKEERKAKATEVVSQQSTPASISLQEMAPELFGNPIARDWNSFVLPLDPEARQTTEDARYIEMMRSFPYAKDLSDEEILAERDQMIANSETKIPSNQSLDSKNSITWDDVKTFGTNFAKNPLSAIVDGVLWLSDRKGVPTNATNMLRDWNVSLPYRASSAIRAGYNTLVNGGNYEDNFYTALANPSWFEKRTTISPLMNTEENYTPEQLEVIYRMAGDKGYITNSDIKRESVDGGYGKAGSVGSYFSPTKVVQTSLGQTSGNDEYITDVFDVNTQSNVAKHDNEMYWKMMEEDPGANYQTLRAILPYIGAIDVMPDEYKIQTRIKR